MADRETDSCTAEAKAFSTIQRQNPTPNPQNSSAPNWQLWCWWQKDRKRNLALASQSCSKETPRVLQVWRPAEAKLESEKKLFTKPVSLLHGRLNLQLPMEGEGGKEGGRLPSGEMEGQLLCGDDAVSYQSLVPMYREASISRSAGPKLEDFSISIPTFFSPCSVRIRMSAL